MNLTIVISHIPVPQKHSVHFNDASLNRMRILPLALTVRLHVSCNSDHEHRLLLQVPVGNRESVCFLWVQPSFEMQYYL
jgi:hypothetical protein